MQKKRIALIIATALITNFSSTTLEALASEISDVKSSIVESNTNSKQATISKFSLYNSNNIAAYNDMFKINNSDISSII